MKKLLLLLLSAVSLNAQVSPPPASVAEVEAGTDAYKYVTPYSLAQAGITVGGGSGGGGVISNEFISPIAGVWYTNTTPWVGLLKCAVTYNVETEALNQATLDFEIDSTQDEVADFTTSYNFSGTNSASVQQVVVEFIQPGYAYRFNDTSVGGNITVGGANTTGNQIMYFGTNDSGGSGSVSAAEVASIMGTNNAGGLNSTGLDAITVQYETQIDDAAAVGYYAAGRARREARTLYLTNSGALVLSAGQRATNLLIGPNLNGSGTGRTIVNHQYTQRFRMSGYLKAVSLWVPPDSATSYNITFRTFKLGQSTNHFTAKYSSSAYAVVTGSNYVTVTDTIPVEEGDFIGVYLPSTGGNSGVSAITNGVGDSVVYVAGNITSSNAYFSGKLNGYSLNIKAWTSAPIIAYCGDSITAGHHGLGVSWYPYFDTSYPAISGFIYNSYPYQFWTNYASEASYCNYSAGGKNTAWIAANSVAEATNDNASVLVFAGGANDIAQELPWASMLAGLNTMRQKWPQDRPLFVAEILPFQGSHLSEVYAQNIRDFNANIRLWAATNNAAILPFWKYFGDTDLDYLTSEYDSGDGVHLSTAGAQLYARLIKPYLSSVVNTFATTNNWP